MAKLKTNRRRLPPRGPDGQFKPRAKRSTSSPKKKSGKVKRRRRSNPTMPLVVANPTRSLHRAPRNAKKKKAPAKLRRSGTAHTKRRTKYLEGRFKPRRRKRSNPTMSIMGLIKIGAAGMAGIIVARVSRNLYVQYVSPHVVDATDPNSWRNWLDEVLQVVAAELGVVMAERAAAKLKIDAMTRTAFLIGGTAEVVRTGVGKVLERLSPTTDRKMLGLDGMGAIMERPVAYIDQEGRLNTLQPDNTYRLEGVVARDALEGILGRTQFSAS